MQQLLNSHEVEVLLAVNAACDAGVIIASLVSHNSNSSDWAELKWYQFRLSEDAA